MPEQIQSDLFHVVDLDAERKEIRRFTVNQKTDPRMLWAQYGKPPEARARYIWNASRGPDVPKPKTLSQLLTMTPRKRPVGLRVDGRHPPRNLTPKSADQGLIADILDDIETRLEREKGPVIVHLFDPPPPLREGGRRIDFNSEITAACARHDRVQVRYVDAADWALP